MWKNNNKRGTYNFIKTKRTNCRTKLNKNTRKKKYKKRRKIKKKFANEINITKQQQQKKRKNNFKF